MLILGLDLATSSGFCLMDTTLPPAQWRVLAIEAEGEFHGEKVDDFTGALLHLLEEIRPDFCAIEMPQRFATEYEKKDDGDRAGEQPKRTINPNAFLLQQLYGAAVAVLRVKGIPFGEVAVNGWRAAYYGSGFKPKGGDWKKAAVDLALRQRIKLPPTKKAARDAAEAVGIASAWPRCSFIPKRHHQAFMALRTKGRIAA